MFKYYEQNSLWLKQFYHQLQVTNRNQPFYIKLIENMMQIGAIQDLVPPAVLLLVETDSEETKDKERPLKRKSAIQRRISSIYQMEGNSQEEFAAIAKIFGSLPAEQRDYVCSEFMAENLLIEQQSAAASSLGDQHHPATTVTTISLFGETIVQLYDLYKLCFLGASQPMLEVFSDHQDGAVPQVGEVDILLTQELIAIMKQAMKNISLINQSAIINSLSDADPGSDNEQEEAKNSVSRTGAEGSATEEEDTRPVPLSLPLFPSLYHHLDFISNKIDTLMQFISFYFLDPQQSQSNPQQSLSNQQVFEIVKVYLAIILALFYKVYLVLLEIYVEIGRLYDQHLLNNQQNNQEFSLLQELQRLTLMNFTAEEQAAIANADGGGGRVDGGDNKVDVKTLIGRLRKHEVDLAGKKFSGLYRVMEIFLKYALKRYFRQWRSHTKSHKQYELEIADKEERLITRQKADIFQMWRKLFTKRRLLKKAVSRMLRTLNYNFEKTKLACFRKWKEVIFQMNRLHPMISELKLQILSLQSEVELLQSVGNGVPDSQHLPAPPSLPYSSRSGPHQQQQHLSSTGPSLLAAERALNKELLNTNMTLRDSVKELELKLLEMNGVTAAKRKDLVYHYLLDKENQIITSKQEMKLLQAELEQLRNILYLQQQQQQARNPANNKVPNTNRPVSNAQNSGGGNNTYFRGPGNLLPARPTARDGSLPMGKVEAKFIILNEIQRLKRSLQSQEQDKQQYQSQRLQESDYYTQLSIANQTLCHRMNEFNRSTVALRELLRQKIGFDGMLEIVESMQNMGIDAYPLLGTIPNPGVSGGGAMSGQKIEERIQRIARGEGGMDEEGPFPKQILANANLPSTLLNNTVRVEDESARQAKGVKKVPPTKPSSDYQRTLEEVFLENR